MASFLSKNINIKSFCSSLHPQCCRAKPKEFKQQKGGLCPSCFAETGVARHLQLFQSLSSISPQPLDEIWYKECFFKKREASRRRGWVVFFLAAGLCLLTAGLLQAIFACSEMAPSSSEGYCWVPQESGEIGGRGATARSNKSWWCNFSSRCFILAATRTQKRKRVARHNNFGTEKRFVI